MKFNIPRFDFHLFEDGGGAGASAGAGASEGSGYGQEASDFARSIGMDLPDSSKLESKKRTEYGRSQDNGAEGQVGSDNSGQGKSLEAEFAELVGKGGRYHDIYGQKVQDTIQSRFKNQQDYQAQINSIAEDMSPLFMNYGLETGDFEGLKDAIAHDDSFYQAGAEKAGLDLDQYKAHLKLQADAERGRRITEAYQKQQKDNEMYAQWEQDADSLRQSFPNFDLVAEIKSNDAFTSLIRSGVDVQTAFVSTHLQDILSGANAEASKQATSQVVSAIQQRSARPAEGAMRHTPAIERKSDPSTLTDEDMDEIFRRVQDGEQFAF